MGGAQKFLIWNLSTMVFLQVIHKRNLSVKKNQIILDLNMLNILLFVLVPVPVYPTTLQYGVYLPDLCLWGRGSKPGKCVNLDAKMITYLFSPASEI